MGKTATVGRVTESDGAHVIGGLEAALNLLGVPAIIASVDGLVMYANAAAATSLGVVCRCRAPVPGLPANSIGSPEPTWVVTPLDGPGLPGCSLLILRSPDPVPRRRWNLTQRQLEVLELVARGMTNRAIAESLGIRPGTVEFHVSAIFDKAGVNSRTALIATVMGR